MTAGVTGPEHNKQLVRRIVEEMFNLGRLEVAHESCCHAKRAGAQTAGGPSRATRGLRHLLSGRARNARDVSVLRAIYLLRSRAREAHRRGQCLGPWRVHRLCRLGEGPHEAELTYCSLVKAMRKPRVCWSGRVMHVVLRRSGLREMFRR